MPFVEQKDLDVAAIERAMAGAAPGSYDAHVLAWLLNQAPLPEHEATRYWRLWSANAYVSAGASAFVIALILGRAPLRRVSYNHLVVGLATPDFLFALFCGTTCLLNATHGHWYDGEDGPFGGGWICDFQAFYSVFGTAGSMWVNVLITFELEAVSRSMSTGRAYAPPTTRQIYGRLAAVFAFVVAVSWFVSFGYRFWPGLIVRPISIRGLECLPVDYDLASLRFKFGGTLTLMFFAPLAIVAVVSLRVYLRQTRTAAASAADDGAATGRSRRISSARHDARGSRRSLKSGGQTRLSGATRVGALVDPLAASDSAAAAERQGDARPLLPTRAKSIDELLSDVSLAPPAPIPRSMRLALNIQASAMRGLRVFFARLLFVMLVLWGPWLVSWSYALPGSWTFVTGAMAHLQALLSACIYLTKEDIFAELRAVGAEARAALGCGASARAGGAATGGETRYDQLGALPEHEQRAEEALGGGAEPAGRAPAAALTPTSSRRASRASTWLDDARDGALSADEMLRLASEAEEHVRSLEQTPMMVVPFADWRGFGSIPRSTVGIARRVRETDVVVFVSHRWWSAPVGRPDDAHGTKYALINLGVERLIGAHGLDAARVAIWIDYASVDQVDAALQAQGIASLVAYAARSHFVLIPVETAHESMLELEEATHPIQLLDYGERAWCRLEVYAFVCLAELTQKQVAVYAYGNLGLAPNGKPPPPPPPTLPSTASGSALRRAAAARAGAGCAATLWARGADALRRAIGVGALRREQLRPLLSTYGAERHGAPRGDDALAAALDGARFHFEQLPSSGELSFECDRAQIARVEAEIRQWYVTHALLVETARFRARAGSARTFSLRAKQLGCEHASALVRALLAEADVATLSRLDLAGNLLGGEGVRQLRPLLLSPAVPALRELNLSFNSQLGVAGARALADVLARPHCALVSLELVACGLTPAAGSALAPGLRHARRLRHLDLSDNLCDDLAVTTMLDAVFDANAQYSVFTTVVVEGNELSDGVRQVIGLMHMRAAGLTTLALEPTPEGAFDVDEDSSGRWGGSGRGRRGFVVVAGAAGAAPLSLAGPMQAASGLRSQGA